MPRSQQTAGAFDIRNVIGGLIGLYGLILTLMGIFGNEEGNKTGGVNANLWAGIVMLIFGIVFLVWARVRPVVVDHHAVEESRHDETSHDEAP